MFRRKLRCQCLESRFAPALATWDGGGTNNLWTTPANWAGDVAPNPGDDLVFPLGAGQTNVVNDFIAGTGFNSIRTEATNYQLSGNRIALAAGFQIQGSIVGLLPLGLSFTLMADQTFTGFAYDLTGTVDLNGHALRFEAGGSTKITGAISGAGSVTFSGGYFETLAVNSYTGPTWVINGCALGVEGSILSPITLSTNPALFGSSSLSGTGTVGNVTINNNCSIAPGMLFFAGVRPLATLTTGNLTMSGAQTTTLFLTDGNGDCDRIDVHGTVQLSGVLNVAARNSVPLHQGDECTLLSNDGTDPVVGTFANVPEGGLVSYSTGSFRITYHGGDGNDVVASAVPFPSFAVAAGQGGLPLVNVYDSFGELLRSFNAYDPAFRGGVHLATADMNADGAPDIITAPGLGGGPVVRVWDGITGALTREFNAYDPAFRGGASIAVADLNADGFREIITGAGPTGGPHVKSFDGSTFAERDSFFAYDASFRGGVSVAGLDGYSLPHSPFVFGVIVTGAGPGGGPHVKAFRSPGFFALQMASFFAYDLSFQGGVNVAARGRAPADFDFSTSNVVTAPASNGGPDVRIYDLQGGLQQAFLPYSPSFFGGVNIAIHPLNLFGADMIITGPGPGGGPHVQTFTTNGTPQRSLIAFDPAFTGGVFVG